MVLDRGHAPEASNEIAPWTPGDRDEVLAFILGIQRGEFGIEITAQDQPDLADVARAYESFLDRKMFVAREQRGGAGLAARLMDTLVAWAGASGIRTIYLGTTAVMNAAHRFYEKQGFTLIDPAELPASFPRMAVDSRFYRRELA